MVYIKSNWKISDCLCPVKENIKFMGANFVGVDFLKFMQWKGKRPECPALTKIKQRHHTLFWKAIPLQL